MVEEEYPSGRVVKNEYESDGDLARVFGQANPNATERTYANSFGYTASGGISRMRLGNGRWETAKFNTRQQVIELGLGAGPTSAGLWKVGYEYGELDSNGNVETAKNTGNIARQTLTVLGTSFVQSYRYDSLYRLTEAFEKTGTNQNWIQNWTYDRYGNRNTFTQNIAGITNSPNPTVDANTNRFVEAGTNFDYDLNGNSIGDLDPIDSQIRNFIFNGDNKQTEVKKNGVTVGRYYYDGEGKRVKKHVPGTGETTIFVYSAGKLVAEYSTIVAPPNESKTAFTTTDHLGSPRIITDQLGQVKSRRDFLPFGEELFVNVGARAESLKYGSSADNIRQKFTGYQKDSETSLDFAEARMYENRFGRFTAVDPLLASGQSSNPQTFNRYNYVGNSPLTITDPLGLDWYRQQNGNRWTYQYFDSNPGNEWQSVDFGGAGNRYLQIDNVCITDACDSTRYLNRYGGSLTPEEYQSQMNLNALFASYSAIDPKQIGMRHPEMSRRNGDAMWAGAALLNMVPDTYNLGAGGINYFGGNLPYAPTFRPDENTSPAGNFFFYGTNGAFALQGGISLYQGLRSGISHIQSGGMSFNAYRASRGPSEILGSVDVMTRSGRTIPYAIRTELSHMFISQKMQSTYNLPNWLVNNRINVWKLNTVQHALIDSSRFRTLPIGLKPQVGWTNSQFTFFTRSF